MSIYIDHSAKFCVLGHNLYHVVPCVIQYSDKAIVRDKVLCVWSVVVSGNSCVCILGMQVYQIFSPC